jgi:flagellar biosynthesis protein FliR
MPVKVLLSLSLSIALFPMLVARGSVQPGQAAIWGATAGGIVTTVLMEGICALILGYTARLAFESIQFGGNLVGTFMGFSTAAQYDPHQESQTQIVAQIQTTIAMLLFLALDGHHLMLRASLQSYQWLGVGGLAGVLQTGLTGGLSQKLIGLTGDVIKYGMQLAAPAAVCMFVVNVAFGVVSKAMPQLNVLVLSFAVTALVGFAVMFLSIPEFQGAAAQLFTMMEEGMISILQTIAKGR